MKLSDLFYLHKSDRISIFFLLALIAIVVGVVWRVGSQQTSTQLTAEDSLALAPVSDTTFHRSYRRYPNRPQQYYKVEGRRVERFAFDPNTADSTQLLRLGLSPFMVRNIYRYRAAGGTYRRPEDFARTYGLTRKQFEELKPYIHISDYYQDARSYYTTTHTDVSPRDTIAYPVKLVPGETVQLNTADTTALKHVPGIGSGFARRIVRYRQQLGGFVSVGPARNQRISRISPELFSARRNGSQQTEHQQVVAQPAEGSSLSEFLSGQGHYRLPAVARPVAEHSATAPARRVFHKRYSAS